jgi:DNA polymerase
VKVPPVAESEPQPVFGEEPPLPTDEYVPSLDMSEAVVSSAPAVPAIDVRTLDWPALESAVSACTACELHQSRTQTVFGVGSHTADWMVIGEAPGAEEDQQGEPFVGPSGHLLDNMLRALGLQREQVFISNILKCRPPEDRDPLSAEITQCEPYLQRQIELVKPRLILAMGAVAAHNLLKLDTPVTKLRGQLHHYGETPLVVTYHPAYLLRKPSEKARSWADLRFAASVVNGTLNDGGPGVEGNP